MNVNKNYPGIIRGCGSRLLKQSHRWPARNPPVLWRFFREPLDTSLGGLKYPDTAVRMIFRGFQMTGTGGYHQNGNGTPPRPALHKQLRRTRSPEKASRFFLDLRGFVVVHMWKNSQADSSWENKSKDITFVAGELCCTVVFFVAESTILT